MSITKFLAFVCLLASVSQADDANHHRARVASSWRSHKFSHSLRFSSTEDQKRYKIFRENYLKIIEHNKKNESYQMKLNNMAHLSEKEFHSIYLTPLPNNLTNISDELNMEAPSIHLDADSKIPDSFDWRTYGYVTPAKHQQTCGSCYAFGAAGAIETIYARKYKVMKRFAEQELVDCDKNNANGNWGCNGGFPSTSFKYVVNNGISEDKYYSYKNAEGICQKISVEKKFKIKGFAGIPYGDEEQLKRVIATYGPVAATFDASGNGFAYYSNGIYYNKKCDPNNKNHVLLIVGYGRENGYDYWIAKNSWGSSWGLNGFIKILRNYKNMCGIASLAYYPYL